MKIFTRLDNKNDIDTRYKQNGMYQTAIKYMKILKENGRFEHFNPLYGLLNVSESGVSATVVTFHALDECNDDLEISKDYHRFNGEYDRLPYNTDKDIALVVYDDAQNGEISFIFHEYGANIYDGVYDEIRFLDGVRNNCGECVQIDEI